METEIPTRTKITIEIGTAINGIESLREIDSLIERETCPPPETITEALPRIISPPTSTSMDGNRIHSRLIDITSHTFPPPS